MKKKKLGERSGYIMLVSIFLIVLNIVLGVFLINRSQKAIITQIEGRMLDITNTAAAMLDGDKLKNLTKDDYYSKDYQDAIKTLTVFQENIQLEYIYCIQQKSEREFVFSVDPTEDDPGEFGSPIVYTDALYNASKGHADVDKQAYADEWGVFYSAYSPVFDSDGNVAIIVAVDFSSEWYDEQVFALVRTVLIICAVSLLLGGLIVFLITQHTHRRNRRLYAQLNSLADNIENLVGEVSATTHAKLNRHFTNPTDSRGNEIKDLSNKINSMQDSLLLEIESVHRLAYIDALTAVGNTAAYIDRINALNDQIKDGAADFSVIAFDLNGLKLINDRYGHEFGDKALMATADLIGRVFLKENVYRIGGDEFFVILPHSDKDKIKMLFDIFAEELEALNNKKKACPFTLSISKGYAFYEKDKDSEFKKVSHRADVKMYRDKDNFYKTHKDIERRV